MNIEKELKRIVLAVSEKDISPDDISDKTILTKDLGYNSVKLITLIVEIEAFFKICIDDEELEIEKLNVFSALTNIVKKTIAGNNSYNEGI